MDFKNFRKNSVINRKIYKIAQKTKKIKVIRQKYSETYKYVTQFSNPDFSILKNSEAFPRVFKGL